MNDPKEEIMESTYTALCKHGYAELSIQKIADESEKGKSAIYYHYEDKDELMLAFIDYMTSQMEKRHKELEELPQEKQLDETLEMVLGIRDDEMWELRKAMIEMQAQASKNQDFRKKFRKIDSMMVDNITRLLDNLDTEKPGETAELLVSCIEGSVTRKVSTGDREGLEDLKASIKHVAEQYIAEGCKKVE
jgi:AcrR family transcriptional regulator